MAEDSKEAISVLFLSMEIWLFYLTCSGFMYDKSRMTGTDERSSRIQ